MSFFNRLVWFQVVLLTNDYRIPGQTLGQALIGAPPFWLLVILTLSIILPWVRLRKVPVRAEVLSSHAIRLYFDYGMNAPLQCNEFIFIFVSQSHLYLAPSRESQTTRYLNGMALPPFRSQT